MPPPASAARDRAGYEQPYTRDELIAAGQYADLELARAVAECTIDGVRAGGLRLRRRAPSPYETRVALKDGEFEMAARALARIGARRMAFTSGERPDWKITLEDGRRIGVEATEVNPSAGFSNRVMDLEVALKDAVDAAALIPDRDVFLRFGARAFVTATSPEAALTALARRDLLVEMIDFLRAGAMSLDEGRIVGYPTLAVFDVHARVYEGGSGSVELPLGATTFSPLGAYRPTIARVNAKLRRVTGYTQIDPLWLVVWLTDSLGQFSASIDALAGEQLRGGFERVIVTDGRALTALDRT